MPPLVVEVKDILIRESGNILSVTKLEVEILKVSKRSVHSQYFLVISDTTISTGFDAFQWPRTSFGKIWLSSSGGL